MADLLEFPDIFSIVRGGLNSGRLKMNKTGIVFKSTKTGALDSIPLAEIDSSQWMRVARGFGIKVVTKDGGDFRFHGFKEVEYEKLNQHYKNIFEKDLDEIQLCVKGHNWGAAKFKGSVMSFEVDNKTAFEIPLKDVSSATTGKNEVTIEFHRNDDSKVSLMEMRFFVQSSQNDETEDDPVKLFQEAILLKADVIQATGEAIITFPEVACLTPRGKYSIRVYPTFLQLHGKSYDYKVPHTTLLRLFLLPHQDNRFMFFVISLDPPLRQGQTRYPFLILQFERDEEMTCTLNLTQTEIEEKYGNKLTSEMSGAIFEVVSRVFKEICQKKITVPGNFKSQTGTSAITCSYKASSGLLYPLERGFIFVHKPALHIRTEEIISVNFARGGTTGRTFDFEVDCKNNTQIIFSNIPREEYTPLFDFVNTKKLRIKNKGGKAGVSSLDQMIESDDDDHDAYLRQMKAEGAVAFDIGDDDESSSEDEDYNPDKEKIDDVKEEYESDVETSSGDDSDSDYSAGGEEGDEAYEALKNERKMKRKSESKPKAPRAKRAKSEGGGRKKKKKDKDAPKRPMSGFMLFTNANREKIKEDNPGIACTEIAKKSGELWKALGDKSEWDAKYAEGKVKYEEEMKVYREILKERGESPEATTKKKLSSDSSKKKSSPRKKATTTDNVKFKSKEYISDSASSADDDDESKSKSKDNSEKSKKKEKEKDGNENEGDDSGDSEDSEAEHEEGEVEASTRSTRSKGDEDLKEMDENPDGPEEIEAEMTDKEDDKEEESEKEEASSESENEKEEETAAKSD